ncbi:MAG: hypothetical protein HWQ38_12845 [Nostoc sp. NMS7]|uniref:hypothetical protein n=1 Tax=Nostoc sp. NMS7 TaxID=2815391 RepID=UPI0025F54B7A|nr:hypothetical protein [Nostoc sp. NMS7]MBN3947300.1 hypothetical protein [Nostoc sp. NMS7]
MPNTSLQEASLSETLTRTPTTLLSTSAQYFSTRGFSFRDANANANDFSTRRCSRSLSTSAQCPD